MKKAGEGTRKRGKGKKKRTWGWNGLREVWLSQGKNMVAGYRSVGQSKYGGEKTSIFCPFFHGLGMLGSGLDLKRNLYADL
jgi:hypothetical protein